MPVYPYMTPASWSSALSSFAPRTSSPSRLGRQNLGGDDEDDSDDDDDDEGEDKLPPVMLVKGPKRSGKSTFARSLLNNLLARYEKVAWLECDLGQGEFGCGGVVGIWMVDRPVLGESSS